MESCALTHNYQVETDRIVSDVFLSMLQMDVQAVEAPEPPNLPVLTATVHFVGTWQGALRIECTAEQLFEFIHRMLGVERPTEVDADVCDAFGELANMIGGNLKAVLPRTVHLSIPSVIRGRDYDMHVCRTITACKLAFSCEAGVFWVTLLEFVDP